MSLPSRIIALPDEVINQIAAGEVVERPASVVKELIENALDAGASQIEVFIENGGLRSIIVTDNGRGITAEDMPFALERHATSKLKSDAEGKWDLLNIASMGFRGEALPSIASTARLSLTSRAADPSAQSLDQNAPGKKIATWTLSVDGGEKSDLKPATGFRTSGTRVEVHDLFYATPARLKFLKSPKTEFQAITDNVKRLAMVNASVGFQLFHDQKKILDLKAEEEHEQGRLSRLSTLLGRSFQENALPLQSEREGMTLKGFAGLPTFNRSAATHQYLFVNGRPVRDKLLAGSIRGAYQDFLARDRHPVLVLFLEIPLPFVDVNAHPAKTEVRFRNPSLVRGFLVGTLKMALAEAGHKASPTLSQYALGRARPEGVPVKGHSFSGRQSTFRGKTPPTPHQQRLIDGFSARMEALPEATTQNQHGGSPPKGGAVGKALGEKFPIGASQNTYPSQEENARKGTSQKDPFRGESSASSQESSTLNSPPPEPDPALPLGLARAQMHENYILAQTQDGIVIVDQHAAHERLVYEGMKRELETGGIHRQSLLIPEIIELDAGEVEQILAFQEKLKEFGLVLERFGNTAIAVRESPALLGQVDLQRLIKDVVDDIMHYGETFSLKERLEEVCSTLACHGSIRSGRRLNVEEMNTVLRQMEKTPHSGQCNHGRPTYVELKLADIERLFGRR